MLRIFSLACLCLLLFGVLSCAADVAPTGTDDHGPAPAEQAAEGQRFEVQLPRDVTVEAVVPAIVAAGHAELAAACESMPGAAIRILNPLASGSYEDVSCASVLEGDASSAATGGALASDECDGPIGTVQQKWSPFGLGCTIAVGAAVLFSTYVLCPRARTPQDEKYCGYVTNGGFAGLGVACVFM